MPRFDQSFNGLCEQNLQDTLQLKQRYLDAKNKRAPKSKDKKQQDSIQSSVHVQQKFLKRPSEDHDGGGPGDGHEPPVKLQCTTQHGTHQPEGLTKFSVEIVQQLEFTTSAANSQPQQISTNVTVKAHTNASVKSDISSPKSNPSTPASGMKHQVDVGGGGLVDCVKQEPDNDFADLDQCAAALEKDAAANGGGFGGFTDLIGEDTNDEIITSAAFKDLISDISSYPEFMKDFDFEDKSDNNGAVNGLKVEDLKDLPQPVLDSSNKPAQSPLVQNQNYSPPVFDNQAIGAKSRVPYSNMDFAKTELSPAAQTLKQMAEQHQHKNQMGLNFNPNARVANARSPYPDFQFQGDYGSPNSNSSFHKGSPSFPQPDVIKQEMIFQGNEFDMKRKGMYNKQQYSPYGSPNAGGHGSPGYLPRGGGGANGGGGFAGGTPPRPPSGPGGNNSGTTLQINQAQQLHISQQSHGHAIQVSAGQHLHLSGDIKGNVSIAAQQGMHFSQQHSNTPPQQTSQGGSHQQNPLSGNQQQPGMPQQNQGGQQHPAGGASPLGAQQQAQNSSQMPGLGNNSPMHPGSLGNGMQPPGGMQGGPGGLGGMGNGPVSCSTGMPGNANMHSGLGGMPGQSQMNDSYSISQSQTINFTQQTLRQRGPGGPTIPMGPGPMPNSTAMGPRHMAPTNMEQQQKLIHQQQMLRAQVAMQQHMIRPPPPEYKASAGMMQGMPPRFTGAPPSIRRMPHQPVPPSGPMIRPHNMYMMRQQQQQHINTRQMYPRQQAPMAALDSMPQHANPEWRHLLMTQQQNANFNSQLRPNIQHQGFNMNPIGMHLSALQHQQMRNQQNMMNPGMGGNQQSMGQPMSQGQVGNQGGPLTQMSSMNQQMMHMQQQQQQSMMQQNNSQMPISNVHLQQSQSLSVSHTMQQSMSNQLVNSQSAAGNPQNNPMSSFNAQSTDFSLEFLENLQATDTSGFTDQELLNSFDADSGFNLDF